MNTVINDEIRLARRRIAKLGGLLFDRHLTDAAGGNISVRVGDRICMSPSYSGSLHQWQLDPDDVLVVTLDGQLVAGDGKLSRESNVHFKLHRAYGDSGKAVIHAHPRNLMVFAAMALPMPPVLEANLKFGEVPCIDYAPAHSTALAENVVQALASQEKTIAKHAAGVIAPWHGLFLMGKDLDAAFDAVERFDTNAYCLLTARQTFGISSMMQDQREQLRAAIEQYSDL